MNRNTVKRNLRSAIFAGGIGAAAFAAAFVLAVAWVG